MADYYALLGVPKDASPEQIKKAYRKVALKHHPDRNAGSKEAEERFKQATEAYEVLRDARKRARYDRYGKESVRGTGGMSGGIDFADALEVFMRDFGGFGGIEELFGGRRRGRGEPTRGQSLRIRIPLTLEDVCTGTTKSVRVAVLDSCEACRGTGAESGARPVSCPDCGGAGEQRRVQRSVFGDLMSVVACGRCRGEGTLVTNHCPECRGEGRTRTSKELSVRVPPGVSSQNYVTLRNEGNVGPRGGPRGDVVAHLDVQEDPRFKRDGDDLLVHVPVTFSQAVLGARVAVPTVEGETWVDVPAGTQSGTVARVRGEGLPALNSRQRGDLLCSLVVWVPERLTAEQEKAVRTLGALEDPPPERVDREGKRGFWSKVKEALG